MIQAAEQAEKSSYVVQNRSTIEASLDCGQQAARGQTAAAAEAGEAVGNKDAVGFCELVHLICQEELFQFDMLPGVCADCSMAPWSH